jgi:septum formation protein
LNLPRLFLASQSPRRAHILQTLGIPFVQAASAFAEPAPTPEDEAAPALYVETLARLKAAHCVFPDGANTANSLVLSADTVVWHGGKILGKPRDEAEARSMLQSLQGREHQVFTGVCLRHIENIEATLESKGDARLHEYSCGHDITTVRFIRVSDQWIARYVATGEPMDKAGAYAAQGRGAALVERIEGDFWNVVGLPLAPLRLLLETVKAPIEQWWI